MQGVPNFLKSYYGIPEANLHFEALNNIFGHHREMLVNSLLWYVRERNRCLSPDLHHKKGISVAVQLKINFACGGALG